MAFEISGSVEALCALGTLVRPLARMHSFVLLKMPGVGEVLPALKTVIWTLSCVDSLVSFQIPGCWEVLPALEARERTLSAVYSLVSLDVVDSEVFPAVLAVIGPVRRGTVGGFGGIGKRQAFRIGVAATSRETLSGLLLQMLSEMKEIFHTLVFLFDFDSHGPPVVLKRA